MMDNDIADYIIEKINKGSIEEIFSYIIDEDIMKSVIVDPEKLDEFDLALYYKGVDLTRKIETSRTLNIGEYNNFVDDYETLRRAHKLYGLPKTASGLFHVFRALEALRTTMIDCMFIPTDLYDREELPF